MKTDYTITAEYEEAQKEAQRLVMIYRMNAGMQNSVGRETPEYMAFLRHAMAPSTQEPDYRGMQNFNPWAGSTIIGSQKHRQAQADRNEYFNLLLGAVDRHDPTRAREPLIRTVCKIAARVLFVLLLVGMGVGVMLK